MNTHPVRFSWFAVALIVTGTAMLLQRLHVISMDWRTIVWGLVTLGGVYKLVSGFAMRRRGGVFWGTIFTTVGTFALLILHDVIDPSPGIAMSGMLIVLGVGFILMFVTVPRDWYVLVPGFFFLLVGGAVLAVELGYYERWQVGPIIASYWPAALVVFGLALLLNRGKETREG